ncbi:MAG: asparagine synthase-related protein, partial [Planctomycetaceae bacterium]|nr:asparagine synthase-related protein [Planctomycetaceae bacterium]
MSYIIGQFATNSSQATDDFNRMVGVMTQHTPGSTCRHSLADVFEAEFGRVRFGAIRSSETLAPKVATNDDLQLAVVLDGHLYTDSAKPGPSDAETLLQLYREQGVDFLKTPDGAFAFAIWDGRKQRLILARDHLGQHPLYYHVTRDRLVFGSALRAIRCVSGVPDVINPVALQRYLFYQYVPEPLSIIDGVSKLSPGHYAIYQNGELTVRKWWNYDFNTETRNVSPEIWRERIAATLPKPMTFAFSGEKQVGTFLSGGIDSTIMTGLASENARKSNSPHVRSFTIGFQHNEYNEAAVALGTSDRLNTLHETRIIEGGIVEMLPQLAWYYDEPFADSSMIPVWFVAQLAAGKADVIFCGDGGDELFAGYLRYHAIALASKLDVFPKVLRQFVGGPLRRMIPAPTGQKSKVRRFKRFLEAIGFDTLERYSQWITLFNKERLAELFTPGFAAQLSGENPLHCCEDVYAKCPDRDLVSAISVVDLLTSVVNDATVKIGTAASAFGLDCRFPFLSREMVELAFQIPSRFKRQDAKGKLILREVYRRFLPPELENRPKMGFG